MTSVILALLALAAFWVGVYLMLRPKLVERSAKKRRSEAAKVAAQKRTRARKEKALQPFVEQVKTAEQNPAWPFPTAGKSEGKTATNGTGRHLND